jgi:small RNA 2'-O-methyltransferase
MTAGLPGADLHHGQKLLMAGPLHAHRLDVVTAHLVASGARSVLDLGCGLGELIERLVLHPQFQRIVGIDTSSVGIAAAGLRFASDRRVEIRHASYTEVDPGLVDFDAAAMIETIEHIDPNRLGAVEQAVFGGLRPRQVLVTTPNAEYNPLHGLQPGQRRHPDHRFEWDRGRFRAWSRRIAGQHGYRVAFHDIGECDAELGASTQMARFERRAAVGHIDASR